MKYYFIVLFIFILWSCTNQTPEEKRIEETLGSELNLKMFKTILFQGDSLSFEDFNQRFKYKSIVYLLSGCSPCHDKYITWHKEMDSIETGGNYTILFIIRGKFADEFLNEVDLIESVEDKYYIAMDPNYFYPEGNREVPDWMFERSILIDENGRICMVGLPFADPNSMKRFKKIIMK